MTIVRRLHIAFVAAIAIGTVFSMPAAAKATGQWREAFQASAAAYDPLDPAFEKLIVEKFRVPASLLESMRPKPPISGTLRFRFAVSAAGSQLRIRISNESGTKPLTLAGASVGLAGEGFAALPGSLKSLTFGGTRGIVIPAGAPVLSDPVDLPVTAQSELVVSTHLPDGIALDPRGGALLSLTDGDQTMSDVLDGAAKTISGRAIVTGAEVFAPEALRVIVTIGDSITDGNRTIPGELRSWPEQLARRLAARKSGKAYAVVNAGIGGNRLLASGWGPSALARLDRDVLRIEGLSHLIVLEGTNDIGMSGVSVFGNNPAVTADDLIAGYRQIIARGHARSVKVVLATIMPFGAAPSHYSPERDQVRVAVNAWIRTSGEPDAAIDFDRVARDPAKPSHMRKDFGGDGLHPGPAGYKAMGDAIDLAIFK